MKIFLIQFTYDHYCQGYEDATIIVLVYAPYFSSACAKISENIKYRNPRDFENLTLQ